MVQKIILNLLIVLLVLEVGAGFLLDRAKKSYDSISTAAHTAGSQNKIIFGSNDMQLPPEDVAGGDFPGITRFPRLVRTAYQQNASGTVIEYQTHDPVNLVLSYYKSQLAKAGWLLDYSKTGEASFTNNEQKINIRATANNGITRLTMSY